MSLLKTETEHFTPVPENRELASLSHDRIAHEFVDALSRKGISATVLEGEASPLPDVLDSLTLVDAADGSDEQTVRLYRGMNLVKSGEAIAQQVCYLLKKPVYEELGFGILKDVELEVPAAFEAVEVFSESPTYENLIGMVDSTTLSESDRRFVASRIDTIQLEMLRHPDTTLLKELEFQHVSSPGGSASQDLSPFVATSSSLEQSRGYGNTLMVMDVPVSSIDGKGEGDEVLVMGSIKPEWISAVARFKPETDKNRHEASEKLAVLIGSDREDGLNDKLSETDLHTKSHANREKDIEAINRDRIEMLLGATDGDETVLAAELADHNITTYKEALWFVADHYAHKRGELIGRSIKPLFDYDELAGFEEKYSGIGTTSKRILDIDAIKNMASRYHWEKQRHDAAS